MKQSYYHIKEITNSNNFFKEKFKQFIKYMEHDARMFDAKLDNLQCIGIKRPKKLGLRRIL